MQVDGWMDGRMDGWPAGWLAGWMDGVLYHFADLNHPNPSHIHNWQTMAAPTHQVLAACDPLQALAKKFEEDCHADRVDRSWNLGSAIRLGNARIARIATPLLSAWFILGHRN